MTFPDFIRSHGIIPPEFLTPGRWQRCATLADPRNKSANVKLCDDQATGFAMEFSSMQEAAVWRVVGDTEKPKLDNAALNERLALRRSEERAGIERARACYNSATPLLHANHDYLRRKRVDMHGCRGIKVDADGWLVVPMYRDGRIISAQRISPEGEKRFVYGAPTKRGRFTIWRPGAVVTILCEGLATGLTVFSAMPNAQVEVCFSAANLIAVAESGDWSGMLVVAGDNDFDTEERTGKNPGVEAAVRAAMMIRCGYAEPVGDCGSDWNDVFTARLTALEKANADAAHPKSPYALRLSALLPIKSALTEALKFVPKKSN